MIRSRRIGDLMLSETSLRRGRESEERIEVCLEKLRQLGEIYYFINSDTNDKLDSMGIDYLVWPEQSFIVPLQVKSSDRGLRAHEEVYGTFIPCVVVRDDKDDETLMREILSALSLNTDSLLNPPESRFG